ncbi:MAG: hypothetical protein J7641_22915 [Cyanobacteria bacterium SID2]|nr:hypothetical protein [Cyanobacteria bacterium SID2]MBP0003970.1 hypothetical protein [Cyanobacteria bacterium SBC]
MDKKLTVVDAQIVPRAPQPVSQLQPLRRVAARLTSQPKRFPGRWWLSVLTVWIAWIFLATIAIVLLANPRYSFRKDLDRDRLSVRSLVTIVMCCVGGTLALDRWLHARSKL